MLDNFLALCREQGVHGSYREVAGHWRYRVKADVEGKAKEALTAEWSKRTIIRQN